MELQQHIAHPHPLVTNENRSNQSESVVFKCSGCEELAVFSPCFTCVKCGFCLHIKCAEAPMEIHGHPFHRHHPLTLSLASHLPRGDLISCRLCDRRGQGFMYHCSPCEFYLHLNCALVPARDTDGNFIETIYHDNHPKHPLILLANGNNNLSFIFRCSRCPVPLGAASDNQLYACFDCKQFFHKKCLELPTQISHPHHPKHQLILDFKFGTSCNLCRKGTLMGFFYHCSRCNVSIHSECALPPPIIEDKKKMELDPQISHPHPLVFNEASIRPFCCSGCTGIGWGPHFSCEDCQFYLHDICAEALSQIDDHPFHPHHPLILSLIPSEIVRGKEIFCTLCNIRGKGFMYHCSSCEFYLDMNCALLPRDTAGNFSETTLHVAHPHPLILFTYHNNHNNSFKCSICLEPLVDASCACIDCHGLFHERCLELPIRFDHSYHRKHQLILDFKLNTRICDICQKEHRGPFYHCSLCNVGIHGECAFPPSIIEDKSHHDHPFTLLFRPNTFTCDACGTQGNNVSYTCSTCNIQVHQKCIPLPRIIAINLHHHPLHRNFFLRLHQHDSKTWECQICFQKVNMEHASYYCSKPDCNFVIHINCAMENKDLYDVIELKNQDEVEAHTKRLALLNDKSRDCITCVIKEIKVGEDVIAAEIQHISHEHNLTFSDNKIKDKKEHCDACILPILSSFYHCSQCDFFLHKACAELSRTKLVWRKLGLLTLHTIGRFFCSFCENEGCGFHYESDDSVNSKHELCVRCATLPHSFIYQAHEPHHIFFDEKYDGHCSACESDWNDVVYRCKDCDFALDVKCVTLPHMAWHQCDEHPLILAYQDNNDYSLHNYCDICEERRNPKHWFYSCEVCDTAAHPNCVLGETPFIKPGSHYTSYKHNEHRRPLTFVKKVYFYPTCVECGWPCQDLSLECAEHGCNYIAHLECNYSSSE